jgi:uncharacterized protein YbaP (TraB family)
MTTEELLQELKNKLERLQKLEEAFAGTAVSTTSKKNGRKKREPMSQETKDKIAAARKAAWAEKKKKAKG